MSRTPPTLLLAAALLGAGTSPPASAADDHTLTITPVSGFRCGVVDLGRDTRDLTTSETGCKITAEFLADGQTQPVRLRFDTAVDASAPVPATYSGLGFIRQRAVLLGNPEGPERWSVRVNRRGPRDAGTPGDELSRVDMTKPYYLVFELVKGLVGGTEPYAPDGAPSAAAAATNPEVCFADEGTGGVRIDLWRVDPTREDGVGDPVTPTERSCSENREGVFALGLERREPLWVDILIGGYIQRYAILRQRDEEDNYTVVRVVIEKKEVEAQRLAARREARKRATK